jgi:pyrroloquinoline-quinone synthase
MQTLNRSIVDRAIRPILVVQDLTHLLTLDAAVSKVAEAYDFRHHPYLVWMQANSTQRNDFLHSQAPFCFAVESFSQALAAVLARIPRVDDRLPLVENIAEEHGHGHYMRSHKQTFRQYLKALGATESILNTPCSTAVLAFNQSILTYCLSQPGEAGSAMLGMIEHLYVGISSMIASTIKQREWVAPGSQSHYAVHEYLDTQHARDLLNLAEPAWSEPRTRLQVAQGLVLGGHYFWSLYRDL